MEIDVYTPRWKVITQNGEKTVTEEQMQRILDAENMGARLVKFGSWIVNIAFIQEAYKLEPEKKPRAVWDPELGKPVLAE